MARPLAVLPAAVLAALVLSVGSGRADGGALDPTFGNGGTATTPLAVGDTGDLWAVAVQPDGKIVAGGTRGTTNKMDFVVVRYNADGSVDPTFGVDGTVSLDLGPQLTYDDSEVHAIVIEPDGKILAIGSGSSAAIVLVRLNPDGSLDQTFGTGGIDFPNEGNLPQNVRGAVATPDGGVVVLGGADGGFALFRFNSDGSLDPNFGGTSPTHDGLDVGSAVAANPDGTFTVGGFEVNPGDGNDIRFLAAHFEEDGSVDTSFGSGGITVTKIGVDAYGNAVAVQPDGKLVVAGGSVNPATWTSSATLVRYTQSGALDTTFGTNGVVSSIDPTGYGMSSARALFVEPDGKLVAVGDSSTTTGDGFGIIRLLSNGAPDPLFGNDGLVTYFGTSYTAVPRTALLQPDGKILVIGTGWPTTNGTGSLAFLRARYLTNDSYALRVNRRGFGSGSVTSKPYGISCGAACSSQRAEFAGKTVVTLTARPARGSAVLWSGACSGKAKACQVTMKEARSVKLTFARCEVPNVVGKRVPKARAAVLQAHCAVGRVHSQFSKRAKGTIIRQSPQAYADRPAGARVSLVFSKGKRR